MEHNRIAVDMILSKIAEDLQSTSCPNLSYSDIQGPVASAYPTGSPYADPLQTPGVAAAAAAAACLAAAAATAQPPPLPPPGTALVQPCFSGFQPSGLTLVSPLRPSDGSSSFPPSILETPFQAHSCLPAGIPGVGPLPLPCRSTNSTLTNLPPLASIVPFSASLSSGQVAPQSPQLSLPMSISISQPSLASFATSHRPSERYPSGVPSLFPIL
ncbi:unnamed protein product [Protopolystoma xenopodis]|uniref:Uncharacterized protein n=1 Tax=Protopolystoma xenopodis TaxID=117903 RepID=A0A448XNS3_9PLAT|nr:unnamed protein product [Protopolystoma xenopodis]